MHVVLADPSRTTLKYVARLLEARNHQVSPFTDGREALDCIKSDPTVDAVITSAEPTSICGIELCWETRLLATNHRPIHVLLMSSYDEDNKLVEALDSGADDFLRKPLAAEELYARLRAAERLGAMQRELIRAATTDSLTGVLNRRAFFSDAKDYCARAEAGSLLCAIMLDIDYFKRINDEHGHNAGDEAIRAVASAIEVDNALVGRLGGEEFAVLLEGRKLADAAVIAERLRRRFAALRINIEYHTVVLTCSFGVSEWRAGDTVDTLLKRADMALYEAKIGGRNRVVAADSTLLGPLIVAA